MCPTKTTTPFTTDPHAECGKNAIYHERQLIEHAHFLCSKGSTDRPTSRQYYNWAHHLGATGEDRMTPACWEQRSLLHGALGGGGSFANVPD